MSCNSTINNGFYYTRPAGKCPIYRQPYVISASYKPKITLVYDVWIYDKDDNIIRRLEEIRGECIDPGYVTFFTGSESRAAQYNHYLVDFAPDGTQTILHDNPSYFAYRPDEWYAFVGVWAEKHVVVEQEEVP